MMSVTSSTTSGMVVNSWSAPSTRMAVMAAPWSDERSTRRSELPTRDAEAALERLAGELAVEVGERLGLDRECPSGGSGRASCGVTSCLRHASSVVSLSFSGGSREPVSRSRRANPLAGSHAAVCPRASC